MKQLSEILVLSKEYVLAQPHGRPKHEIEEFIAQILGFKSRLDLYVNYDKPLSSNELDSIRLGLKRLARGEPLAYILGLQSFFGYDFKITNAVLIPRPETEIVVERALDAIDRLRASFPTCNILDCCCGSGCIGLTIKKERPHVTLTLSDISLEALSIAQLNGESLQVDAFYTQSDLFSEQMLRGQQYALVVSNPPYLSQKEWEVADFSVKQYEPRLALLGGGAGLEFYERIASTLSTILCDKGEFIVEIGAYQGTSVSHLFQDAGFKKVLVHKDFQGRDRIITGVKNPC